MSEGKTVLIVDDDITLREMYEERLKQSGFLVIGASDGEEAVNKAKSEHPNLIILDIMMPKVNGIDALKTLRDDETTKDIPVIILTALIQEIDKIKDLLTDHDAYFIKSEEMPKDVVDKVNQLLA